MLKLQFIQSLMGGYAAAPSVAVHLRGVCSLSTLPATSLPATPQPPAPAPAPADSSAASSSTADTADTTNTAASSLERSGAPIQQVVEGDGL